MTELMRTDLPTSRKVQLAASALGRQGQHGAMADLARTFGVARGTVYSAKATASEVLKEHFAAAESRAAEAPETASVLVRVDEAQLRRAIVALRAVGRMTLRPIEELLPILYPGVGASYGKIQGIAVEAEEKATRFNSQADLSGITEAALDEMFSQGQPVLSGICLNSGYAFCLQLRDSRGTKDWAEVLRAARSQGVNLEVVVKDAAQGIAAGVEEVYPGADQRDDCFHAKYEIGKVQQLLEQRALGRIANVDELCRRLAQAEAQGRPVNKWRSKLWWARGSCEEAIALHDSFERAAKLADEGMEFVDLRTGHIRSAAEAGQMLAQAANAMLSLSDFHCRRVGRYLRNRTPGLVKAGGELEHQLCNLARTSGEEPVALACLVLRLLKSLDEPRRRWQRPANERHLLAAFARLHELLPTKADGLLNAVSYFLQIRRRASSAIEGLNSVLRPHLYLHRGVTQGYLELFRAYFNLRTRRSGPFKGMSAHQRLTGQAVKDWLTLIGFPPSAQAN